MKNSALQLIFLLLITTFSFIWISDKLSVIIENEKFSYYETTEKSDAENQTENKLKTQFINKIDLLNFSKISILSTQKNNTFYLFKIKEASFENWTPPPETV
jgi:hypothetical protein